MIRNRFTRIIAFALALLVIAGAVPQVNARNRVVPLATGSNFPAANNLPPHDYDVRHIKLDLRFDWEKEQAIGIATLTLTPTVARFQEFAVDAGNMTIGTVTLASGTNLKFDYKAKAEKLKIQLDRVYSPGDEIKVVISYRTSGPTEQSKTGYGGLVFVKPNPADPARHRQIWTSGESEFNREWFPCWDHPNDFATTETTLTVARPLVGISNGRLVDQRDNPDGTRSFHWSMEQPHASYLTSIVVGEFATVEDNSTGVTIISYVYPSEVEAARATVSRVPDMLRFFAERTGAPFPYARYGQAFLYGFNGGMENITLTALEDGAVRDARSRVDGDNDELLAHELAHSWFGDDLTCRWWSDIWLNEGFATYMQAAWDEHDLGVPDFLYRDVLKHQREYLSAWKGKGRRPTVTTNFEDPDELFDSYVYARGAAILHMLRRTVGNEIWWRAIRNYVQKFPHQNVTTEQFRAVVEETAGQKLDWFFDEWVYRMGHPILRVTQSYDQATKKLTLNVRQEQKVERSNQYPQTALYRVPIEVELVARDGSVRIEKIELAAQSTQSFTCDAHVRPAIVNFDHGSTVIKELKFEKSMPDLIYQLGNDPDVTGRLWALRELKSKLSTAKGSAADPIRDAIAHALTHDSFWGVRAEAAPLLATSETVPAREALVAAMNDPNAPVRLAAVNALTGRKDRTLAPAYVRLLKDESYAVIGAAAEALGYTKDAGAFDALAELSEAPSWHDNIRASALKGLAVLDDERAAPLAERYAATGNRIEVRVAALKIIAAMKSDPRRFPLVTEALTHSLELRDREFWRAASAALVAAHDPRAADFCVQIRRRFTEPDDSAQIRKLEGQLRRR